MVYKIYLPHHTLSSLPTKRKKEKKNKRKAEETAQLVKCLLSKDEDLSDSQTHI